MEILKDQISVDEDLFLHIYNVQKVRYKLMEEVSKYILEDLKNFKYSGPIYTRKTFFRNDIFEAILITWYPGSGSPIHDHSENGCLMFLVNGCLNEEIYNESGELVMVKNISDNNVHYIHNRDGKHKVSNQTKYTVYSIHIYSPVKN